MTRTIQNRDSNIPAWPSEVLEWLRSTTGDAGEEISADEGHLRQKIASDPRLADVAETLGKLVEAARHAERRKTKLTNAEASRARRYIEANAAYLVDSTDSPDWPLSRSILFLDRAITLALGYNNFEKEFEASAKIVRAIDELLPLLEKRRHWVAGTLPQANEEDSNVVADREARFTRLFGSLNAVRQAALSGQSFLKSKELPLPRKRADERAKEWFFVRALTFYARFLFNRPLGREVGLMATVCLALEKPISADRVKELRRARSGG